MSQTRHTAASADSPPASLTHLREAEIVRLCGLDGAAHGRDFFTGGAVRRPQRSGPRLMCAVEVAEAGARHVWVEAPLAGASTAFRFGCDCAGGVNGLACEHVAAVLWAWLRASLTFVAPATLGDAPTGMGAVRKREASHPVGEAADAGPSPGAQAEYVARSAEEVARLLGAISATARDVLDDVALLGGAVTMTDLDGVARRSQLGALTVEAACDELERAHLLQRVGGRGGGQAFTGWRMVEDVVAHVRPRFALPAQGDGSVSVLQPVGAAAARTLCHALALLAHAPATFTGVAGQAVDVQAGQADMRLLLAAGEPAPQRFVGLGQTAGVAPGALRLAWRLLHWARGEEGAVGLLDVSGAPVEARPLLLREAFWRWRRMESAAELADLALDEPPCVVRLDAAHPALRPAALASEIRGARETILRLLGRIEMTEWALLDDFVGVVWRLDPLFLRGRQQTYRTPAWWLTRGMERQPLRPTVEAEWRAGEGAYIRSLLLGPLRWFGALDVGRVAGDGRLVFRLNGLGRWLLEAEVGGAGAGSPGVAFDWAPEEWEPALVARGDETIAAQPLRAGGAVLAALEAWGRPTALAGGRVVYTLTAERACGHFDRGGAVETLLASVRRVSGGERVAERVEARLAGWRGAYGAQRISSGWTLLEGRDEATLAEALAAAPAIAGRCRRLSGVAVLLEPGDAAALRGILARRGLTL